MPKTILIVDDDASYAEFLSSLLRIHGFEAHHVASAQSALELLGSIRVDALITDLYMPECDGIELMRQLGKHYRDLPVLGMTTKEDLLPALDRIFRFTGGLAVVRKPRGSKELVAMLAPLTTVRQVA